MENLLQETIDRVNEKKLNIIDSGITNNVSLRGKMRHTDAREKALQILRGCASDAARTFDQAVAGCKVGEIQLRAAMEVLYHVIGKPKVQVDITGNVTPYNILIRQLFLGGDVPESTYSQENEVSNGLVSPDLALEGEKDV